MISAAQKAHIRPVHPFPARMAPSIVWDALSEEKKSLNILDPMAGSGTTLVCARSRGHRAIGCDTDPLALLIARSWCADTEPENIKRRAFLVLERAIALRDRLTLEALYDKRVDAETRHFIDFWFDPENRRDLAALAKCISRVRSQTEKTVLWCAFSRMIITKTSGASLAMDVSHSRPHRAYDFAPVKPFDAFLKSVAKVVKNCPFTAAGNDVPSADIRNGDARSLPLKTASVDMIITSPPYLNAIDYLRGHKLSLVWMGYNISSIRGIRSSNIGSEVSRNGALSATILEAMEAMVELDALDDSRLGMIRRYAWDMNKVMKECARVLKSKGRAILVVGDSAIRGSFVRNSEVLIRLAESHKMPLVSRTTRPLETRHRYLPPPESEKAGGNMQSRMREEVILQFAKA
jgi:DNA modification methylase